jgi:cystathionine beta-synthase
MQENGYWESAVKERAVVGQVLEKRQNLPPLISVSPADTLQEVIELFHRYNISQIPVLDGGRSVGSLQESTLLKLVGDGINPASQRVGAVMGKPLPVVDLQVEISEAYRLLLAGAGALLAAEEGVPRAVITRIDLIDFYVGRA